MADPEQPKLRLKDRRRRLMWVKVAAGTSVVAVSIALVFYASRLPVITISTINVSGTNLVNAGAVEAIAKEKLSGSYAYLVPHANAFFAPISSTKSAIMGAFPPVSSVLISESGFNTLDIVVTERQTAALWCGAEAPQTAANPSLQEDCYLMDASGFIFAKAPENSALHYYGLISGSPIGANYLGGDFTALDATVKGVSDSIHRTPQSVAIVNDGKDVFLTFAEGGVLRFLRTADKNSTIQNVASVFASQNFKEHANFEYVDFRFGDKVYVKFK